MNLVKEFIEIGRWLKKKNSQCGYIDYFNVFKKKYPKKIWLLEKTDWKRLMRKLKRERGIFIGGHGIFVLRDDLMEVEA